jgi:hypothetical protein
MTAWARAGRTVASPSRLARSAPPLRGCGLDRLLPARRGLAKRRIVAAEQCGAKVKKKLEIDSLHADTIPLICRLALEGDGMSGPWVSRTSSPT